MTKSVSKTSSHRAIMEFKFIVLFALVAVTNAGYIAPQVYQAAPALGSAPLTYAASPVVAKVATPILAAKSIDIDYDHHPQYSYAYDVQDSLTGDFKSQHETRDGDIVQGSYSLLEADGTRRIVDYTADGHNGFNAIVHKEPATKVALAAPVTKITTPALTYGAPIQTIAKITSPIATYSASSAIATPAYAPVGAAYAASPAITYGAPSTIAKLATPLAATYTTAHAALATPAYAPGYATPVAKIATSPVIAKIAPHPYIAHVTYTSPLFSYSI